MSDEKADPTLPRVSGESTQAGTPEPHDEKHNEKHDEKHDAEAQVEFTRTITGWKWALVVLAILSSTFLFALDNTVVANISGPIIVEFDAVTKLAWLSVSFLIGAASTNLVWGKVYGQFNTKWLYIINVVIFEAGSALCGAAPNMNAMIVGRAIAGVGGSGMYVGVMTLLAVSTSLHERPLYVSATGLTWGLGTVLGPIVGGGFEESAVGWRYAFYINLFIGAVCAPVYVFLLPNVDPQPGKSLTARAQELDYLGTLLNIGGFVSGIMAISFGGITYAWNSGETIGMFVCAGILLILFGIQQTWTIATTTARRIFPVEFMRSRSLLILFAVTSAGGTAIFVPIYMIPIFFQFTRGDGALDAGVRMLPYICLMVFAVVLNGVVMSKTGLYWPWYTLGGCLVVVGGSLMYTVDAETSTSAIYGYTILIGFGVGCWAQASFSVAQGVVTRQGHINLIPSAVGFITCAQVTGVTIALAIANSLFLNESHERIQKLLPTTPSELIDQAIAGAAGDFVSSLTADEQTGVIHAIVDAMETTYILVIVAGVLTVLLSVLMKKERMFLEAGGAA